MGSEEASLECPAVWSLLNKWHKGTTYDAVLTRGEQRVGAATSRGTRQKRTRFSHWRYLASLQTEVAVTHEDEFIEQ